jgi:hypothetical protein
MAVCVPALAITPFVASLGLAVACCLILAERTGKAVRNPAKTALLARAAVSVGLGCGFAVHKALDQLGAFAGPLLVAGVMAGSGALWPALAVLVIPGATALLVLLWIWRNTADPASIGEGKSTMPDKAQPVGVPGLHSQGACRRARAVRATRDRLRRLRGSTGHIGHGGRRLGWSSVSAVLARAGSHRCRRPSSRPGS